MDKNYNVDDILSEIKRKKSENRSQNPSPFGAAADTDKVRDFKLEIPDDDVKIAPNRPARGGEKGDMPFAPPDPAPSRESRDFNFKFDDIDDASAQDKTPRNPLDATGHVRSITDKAKIRQGYNRFASGAARPQRPKGEFHFNMDDAPEGLLGDKDHESTRVLPKFTTGRELKIEDIQRLDFGGDGTYDDGYEEDDDDDYSADIPQGAKVDFSEYNSAENRDDVAMDIAHTKLWLFVRAAVTFVLTLISFYFMLSGKYGAMPMPPAIWPEGETLRMFMAASTVLTVLVAVVNSSAMGGGLISFFKMRANSDSLVAFAMLAAVAQGIMGIAKPEAVQPAAMSFYSSIACLSMLFNALGKMSMINRIQQNFRVLGADREKRAVLPVDSPEFCREFVPEATRRKPVIVYSVKAGFFTDFLALSYSDKYDVGINRSVAPVCVIGALVVGISTYFLTEDSANAMSYAVSALTAILCVCATFSATFVENVPLSKAAKKLAPSGGMLSGSKAVEDFCDTKAVIMTETDLFGKDYVALQGIKAFSQNRVDEAILDAASVLCALNGALAPVFLKMINGNKKLLKKVDNIVFENGMGVSAWIDSRRVLIGNRKLMVNHGIQMPTDSYERGEAENAPGEPLYLSNSGEVAARFLVGYRVNEELAIEMDQLAARNIRLIVYANDANISAHKIWEVYGYPEELVTIMPTDRHKDYKAMSTPREDAVASIVYTGRIVAMVRSVIACMNARTSILSATVIELVQMVLGYGFVAFLAFMGAIGTLSSLRLLGYQMFWFLAIFIIQQIRQ